MNVVVTGGGTIAPIDDVRHIANASSGAFSARIAEACLARGATVWHVHAPGAIRPLDPLFRVNPEVPFDVEVARLARARDAWHALKARLHRVALRRGTVADYAETLERVLREHPIDVAFLAMAASDYEPEPVEGKLRSDGRELVVRCRPAPKVIRAVRDWAPAAYLVGFKLLSRATEAELIREALEANRVNRADLTVANDLQTLRAGRHTIHLVRPGHPVETFGPGEPIAERLVERAFAWAAERARG